MKYLAAWSVASALGARTTVPEGMEIHGQKVHNLQGGSGTVVFFPHDLGRDSSKWAPPAPALANNR